jgi:hypothetical protein
MKKSHCNGCHEDQIVPGYELATAMKQIKKTSSVWHENNGE